MSLMSYKKHLNEKFLKNELKTSKSRFFFIFLERENITAEAKDLEFLRSKTELKNRVTDYDVIKSS